MLGRWSGWACAAVLVLSCSSRGPGSAELDRAAATADQLERLASTADAYCACSSGLMALEREALAGTEDLCEAQQRAWTEALVEVSTPADSLERQTLDSVVRMQENCRRELTNDWQLARTRLAVEQAIRAREAKAALP